MQPYLVSRNRILDCHGARTGMLVHTTVHLYCSTINVEYNTSSKLATVVILIIIFIPSSEENEGGVREPGRGQPSYRKPRKRPCTYLQDKILPQYRISYIFLHLVSWLPVAKQILYNALYNL